MNIWALEGHKVKVTEKTIEYGYKGDSNQIKKLCKIGEEYTVDFTEVGQSSTTVFLQEFLGVSFNSVNFEDATEQSEEMDRQHPDWVWYNG